MYGWGDILVKRNIISQAFWLENRKKIEDWVSEYFEKYNKSSHSCRPLIYSSIDMRNSGFKLAHVDANAFPAGFNNIHPNRLVSIKENFTKYLKKHANDPKKILLISEEFTRNISYLKNIDALREILSSDGRDCRVGMINKNLTRKADYIYLDGWKPDFIVLNSDLSAGFPELLKGVSQDIVPPPSMGWHSRSKYNHFNSFQIIIDEFCKEFSLDPWLLSTFYRLSSNINFRQKEGLEDIASKVEDVISRIRLKYDEYDIKDTPYVFIKADKGTFGAGIMTAFSRDDIMNINKKARHSMNTINHGLNNGEVLIQEGVPTYFKEGGPSENVYYNIAGVPTFKIVRHNPMKDSISNLNSSGMQMIPDEDIGYSDEWVISMIASLAMMFEN
jgi:glutamate--cysteine ligase